MAEIILVHGMAANRESWFEIPEQLDEGGHSVQWETLSGHEGAYGLELESNVSIATYVEDVKSLFPAAGKVTLIGHSMGGFVISAVAALYPERIEQLIFVAAMMPRNEQSILTVMLEAGISPTAMKAQLEPYQLAYPEVFASQPASVFADPLGFETPAKKAAYDALPTAAVIALTDDVLPTKYQREAAKARKIPEARRFPIDSDHIPQVDNPTKLMEILKPLL